MPALVQEPQTWELLKGSKYSEKKKERKEKKASRGLADVDILFITHFAGSALMGAGKCERDGASCSLRLIVRGLRLRRHVSYTCL